MKIYEAICGVFCFQAQVEADKEHEEKVLLLEVRSMTFAAVMGDLQRIFVLVRSSAWSGEETRLN